MDAYNALHTNKMTVFVNALFLREERSEFYKKFKEQTDIPITLLYYELGYDKFRELHADKHELTVIRRGKKKNFVLTY